MIKQPLEEPQLQELAGLLGLSVAQLINSRGQVFKKLGISRQDLDDHQAAALLRDNPRLMIRPVLVRGREAVIGFKEEQYQTFTS